MGALFGGNKSSPAPAPAPRVQAPPPAPEPPDRKKATESLDESGGDSARRRAANAAGRTSTILTAGSGVETDDANIKKKTLGGKAA